MPPPKKAAKSAAKKAPKKAAKHPDKEHKGHHKAKDLRRVYEHLGRVEILHAGLPTAAAGEVTTLVALAQQQLRSSGESKDAADLLRAAEHLSFAALAGDRSRGVAVSAELKTAIAEHFEELSQRADEHWDNKEKRPETLSAIYLSCRKSAAKAFKLGAYHQALEYIRAAEALAHGKDHGLPALPAGKQDRILALTFAD